MTLFAPLLMIVGTAFLLIAAIGLVRLADPLQRMHAATKAGTLGASLLLIGVILLDEVARPSTGLLTISFLLLTLPVGAQLLARAAYMSGATLKGLKGEDPLAGTLDRRKAPLAERLTSTGDDEAAG